MGAVAGEEYAGSVQESEQQGGGKSCQGRGERGGRRRAYAGISAPIERQPGPSQPQYRQRPQQSAQPCQRREPGSPTAISSVPPSAHFKS